MTAQEIIRLLNLEPLDMEGGYFRQNYRNCVQWRSGKPLSTAIYYLLTPDTFSCLHRLPADEVYHFYMGDPVELLMIDEEGQGSVCVLGSDLRAGMLVQTTVPAQVWQGSHLLSGGSWALLGTTMAPGFTDEDFSVPNAEKIDELKGKFPDFASKIEQLTKKK